MAAQAYIFRNAEPFDSLMSNVPDMAEAEDVLTATKLWAILHADYKRRRLSSRTIDAYRQTWFSFCESLGKKPPLRIGPADLEKFINRPNRGRGKRSGPVLSASSQDTYTRQVRGIYQLFADQQITKRNLLANFVPMRKPEPVPRALTDTELNALFDHIDLLGDQRLELMVNLAYFAALRAGEIARLRVEHIHLRDQPPWMLIHGKGGRNRQLPIRSELVGILGPWLNSRPRTGPLLPDQRYPTRNISPARVSYLIADVMRDAGLEDTGHALRHSWATNTLRAGQGRNVRAVSHYLGHLSLATTENTYVRSYRDDVIQAMDLAYDPRRTTRPPR